MGNRSNRFPIHLIWTDMTRLARLHVSIAGLLIGSFLISVGGHSDSPASPRRVTPLVSLDDQELIQKIHEGIVKKQDATTEKAMRPYQETITKTGVTFEMVPIPGGRFNMGSPEDEADRQENEGPACEVEVSPFWMGKCEVTW